MTRLTLALDVMGGDFGPRVTLPAIAFALARYPMLSVQLFGDQHQITPYLKSLPDAQQQRISLTHTAKTLDENRPFSQLLRQSKDTSLHLAIDAVAKGQAQGCISGGNTGLLMALAKQHIALLPSLARPALTSLIPTLNGQSSVMLDLGANVESDAEQLVQFAEMGHIFAQAMLGKATPRLALLNIGTEDHKGTPAVRQAHQRLKQAHHLNYHGFIEGDKLLNPLADVIVCDGVSGNIALKTLEGAVKNMQAIFKPSSEMPWLFRYAQQALLRGIFRRARHQLGQLHPDRHNGATLLGLSSVVVKSHGGANSSAFSYAIQHAISQVEQKIPAQIAQGLGHLQKSGQD